VPKIIKNQQFFFKLQSKMFGMFFEMQNQNYGLRKCGSWRREQEVPIF